MDHEKQPDQLLLNHVKCKEGYVCSLLLWWKRCNTGASEKGPTRYWKILQRRGINETEKTFCRERPTSGMREIMHF